MTTFYIWTTVILTLTMIAMLVHVMHYSGFTRQQKVWFLLTFVSVMVCSWAELAVHCGYYDVSFAPALKVITVVQFSLSPLLAVFFSGALGLHKEAKRALWFFSLSAVAEVVCAFFDKIFFFDENGYSRGDLFIIYEVSFIIALIYLLICMAVVGRRFGHRDARTIVMVGVTLVAGIVPMMIWQLHITYLSIGLCAVLCYVYYNDLVQQDIQTELIKNQRQLSLMQTHTISGLANLIESRDAETGGHVTRTCALVKMIAENARKEGIYADKIDDHFISLVYTLAPMHDVGKIVVSDGILRKPGKLTENEFEQMKVHTTAGGTIVKKILEGSTDEEYINFATDIALYHHERWDGAGYPKGLSGEEIPLSARIMAVADVFDALVSERCYKKPFPTLYR